MNHNKRVFQFTIYAVVLLGIASALAATNSLSLLKLSNVSIVEDVLRGKKQTDTLLAQKGLPTPVDYSDSSSGIHIAPVASSLNVFDRYYSRPGAIVHFQADENTPALPRFMQALAKVKNGEKRVVRIAWFGDSLIEGDQMTRTIRKLLQELYGGYGVGFVPMQSATASFRNTVTHSWKGAWEEQSFKTKTLTSLIYPSGHVYFAKDGSVKMEDRTNAASRPLYKSLLCGPSPLPVDISVNGILRSIHPTQAVNRIVLDSSSSPIIALQLANAELPLYGISMEPASGVVLDNFSFRGITGLELSKLETEMMQSLMQSNPYDLIVLEYGVNLMWKPNTVDQSWYESKMMQTIKHLKQAMPQADFLLVGTGDRAFRYADGWETAIGMDTLIRTQASLAYANNMAFYNLYEAMGGKGTIVRWAEVEKPAMANKDYIHPNARGADWMANTFFEAFNGDFKKIKQ